MTTESAVNEAMPNANRERTELPTELSVRTKLDELQERRTQRRIRIIDAQARYAWENQVTFTWGIWMGGWMGSLFIAVLLKGLILLVPTNDYPIYVAVSCLAAGVLVATARIFKITQ